MRRTVELTAVIVLSASFTLVACSDRSPTGPVDDASTSFFTRPPAVGFDVLRRNTPLSVDLSVTRTIGPEGGLLEIEGAGIAFVIPQNALGKATTITMSAPAGDAMVVDFAPYGLELEVPAMIRVRGEGTRAEELILQKGNGAELDSVLGVHYNGNPDTGVEPLESIDTYVNDGAIVFVVRRLSGYVVATG